MFNDVKVSLLLIRTLYVDKPVFKYMVCMLVSLGGQNSWKKAWEGGTKVNYGGLE